MHTLSHLMLPAGRRAEGGGEGGGESGLRLLTTLLTEMDGMEGAAGGAQARFSPCAALFAETRYGVHSGCAPRANVSGFKQTFVILCSCVSPFLPCYQMPPIAANCHRLSPTITNCSGVLVMGATNRPQAVDAALVRPGRFDALLYVPPPDEEGRLQVGRVQTSGVWGDQSHQAMYACSSVKNQPAKSAKGEGDKSEK